MMKLFPGRPASRRRGDVANWNGVEEAVDAVLLFNVVLHVERVDTQALFQRLMTQWLAPNGIVIIITEHNEPTASYLRILDRLGKPTQVYYDEAEKDNVGRRIQSCIQVGYQGCRRFFKP